MAGSLLVATTAIGQTRAVTGRITDAAGAGLPGVTVLERGTTNGTSTNTDGSFSLNVQPGATLVISSIGFETQNVAVGSRTSVPITLRSNATELSEAVVVGYGTQTKADLTGSVTQLSAKDVENVPTVSFEQAIQGRTPGVTINQSSGKLGAGVQIRVRGSSSVTASNQPLYVIDGIPVTSQDVGSDTEPLNPLADLNPNDIESITILKDASSSAIYGSRASNGVVLVTTKKGRQGRSKVNVGYYVGTSETTRRREFLNAAQYKELFTEAATNEGYDPQEEFEASGLDINSTVDQNWSDEPFRKGRVEQYDFNVSGGDAKTRFYLSATYNDQTGIIVGNRYRRGSARINLDHSVTREAESGPEPVADALGERPDAQRQRLLQPGAAECVAAHPAQVRPGTPASSTRTRSTTTTCSIWRRARTGPVPTARSARPSSRFSPIKNLTLRTEAGADFLNLNEDLYRAAGTQNGGNTGYGYSNQVQVINYTTNNTATYLKTLNEDHSIDALVGFSFQRSDTQAHLGRRPGLPQRRVYACKQRGHQNGGLGLLARRLLVRVVLRPRQLRLPQQVPGVG